ncbi:MAG: NFACT family protein [Candidatus Latescibacteria bacterium]|nr:NFACT family protein [Candidatus Latescibacterota bacterium]
MDYHTIAAQCALYDAGLAGKRLDAVKQYGRFTVYLGFAGGPALKLSCTPGMPSMNTVEHRYIPRHNARGWHLGTLAGKTLTSVAVDPNDRVATFSFESGCQLVFEMTGRHANLVLVDDDGIIVGSVRRVTSRESGVREVRQGIPYVPPPTREFADLSGAPLQALERRMNEAGGTIVESLAGAVLRGSLLCSREATARYGVDPETAVTAVDRETLAGLLKRAAAMTAEIERGGDGGTVVLDKSGLPRDVFPLKMESAGDGGRWFDSLDEAVVHYALDRERGLELRSLKQSIRTALTREKRSLANTITKIEHERGGESEPEQLDQAGNTLLANLHLVGRGMKTATLPDVYGDGEVEIILDPALDGPRNAERIFTRARKLRSAGKRAAERLGRLKKRLAEIETERSALNDIDDIVELRKLAARHERSASRVSSTDDDVPFPRRFTSVSGLEIIVGRNDRENDNLLRWARKNDFWLHAQGVGGSHVVLKPPGGRQQPDRRSLEQAAAIAAYYSKAKTSAVVPVACTLIKYVVKRRGQGPGQVTYTREKVLFVEPGIPSGD